MIPRQGHCIDVLDVGNIYLPAGYLNIPPYLLYCYQLREQYHRNLRMRMIPERTAYEASQMLRLSDEGFCPVALSAGDWYDQFDEGR